MKLEQMLQEHHRTLDEFSRGDPEPFKALVAHNDDIILANPFGGTKRGWDQAAQALDFAASNFRDGEMKDYETISMYQTADLVTLFEIEHWKAKVGGDEEISPFDLRVTTVFRRDAEEWKVVCRHADPLVTFSPRGPVRKVG